MRHLWIICLKIGFSRSTVHLPFESFSNSEFTISDWRTRFPAGCSWAESNASTMAGGNWPRSFRNLFMQFWLRVRLAFVTASFITRCKLTEVWHTTHYRYRYEFRPVYSPTTRWYTFGTGGKLDRWFRDRHIYIYMMVRISIFRY